MTCSQPPVDNHLFISSCNHLPTNILKNVRELVSSFAIAAQSNRRLLSSDRSRGSRNGRTCDAGWSRRSGRWALEKCHRDHHQHPHGKHVTWSGHGGFFQVAAGDSSSLVAGDFKDRGFVHLVFADNKVGNTWYCKNMVSHERWPLWPLNFDLL